MTKTVAQTGFVGLEQRVLARWRLLAAPAGAPVIVGFSGGADSLALAAVLGRLVHVGGPRPLLVHVDHAWRAESAAEQDRAAALAAALGLPFQGRRVSGDAARCHPGVGREEAARRERYRLLAAAASEAGTDLVALAHHQDDQAETVLLHLARGAGLDGAAGMRPVRRVTVPWWDPEPNPDPEPGPRRALMLWRPLLTEPRAIVRAYTDGPGLRPIADPSNDDPSYRRNALRARVMPPLEQLAPGAAAALARFAALAADDDDALATLAAAALVDAVSARGELRRSAVLAHPVAIQRRLVRRWAIARGGVPELSAERTGAMLSMLEQGEPGKRLEIGAGVSAVVTRDGLRLLGPVGTRDGQSASGGGEDQGMAGKE